MYSGQLAQWLVHEGWGDSSLWVMEAVGGPRERCRRLYHSFNTSWQEKPARDALLHELLGGRGKACAINPPFFCDYGANIFVGENFYANVNCTILDVCEVHIGDNVLLAPGVQIYTAAHPVAVSPRVAGVEFGKPVRIGVNWGSLDQSLAKRMMDANLASANPKSPDEVMKEALIVSALESAQKAVDLGLPENKIILSCKVSAVQDLIQVYRDLGARCRYPLHLGLTEAGMGSKGIVASTAALSVLLQEGTGDTIRISLTPEPGASRTQEVVVGQEILQTMGLRSFTPLVTACPGCGRTTSTVFQELARDIQYYLREQMPEWKKSYPGVEAMNVAVMGCIVNGPGEMADADYGYVGAGPGRITLYKGRTVVERNIPQEEALDRLVELIKKNGDWTPA